MIHRDFPRYSAFIYKSEFATAQIVQFLRHTAALQLLGME